MAGTMTATVFRILGEAYSGTAVICPEARYASVWRHGAARPERLHLSLELWRAVERELADTLPATALPPSSALAEALVPSEYRRSVALRYVWRTPVDEDPVGLVARLDGLVGQVQGLAE
jgi:hypothetical protein